jgi:surface protein
MKYLFTGALVFNQDLSSWNTHSVTDMKYTFFNANRFNGSIGTWDVSQVTNMASMFLNNYDFNQPLRQWNVSNVRNMNQMFWGTKAFNQPLDGWSVYRVTDMNFMFYMSRFNHSLTSWCAPIQTPASFSLTLPMSMWPRFRSCPEYMPVMEYPPFQVAPISAGSGSPVAANSQPSNARSWAPPLIGPFWVGIMCSALAALFVSSTQ